ncbi:FAD-binding and (Fe-S)-binding domain-containing protein [uncultured Psychrosphaera sp.]|uniref:FAD-binding and (Fe-S)-binding domain-containing protein n=1 Tax=uncultured Psychrosphaera sp. TaxID=1403522 RepID=UPI0030FBE46F
MSLPISFLTRVNQLLPKHRVITQIIQRRAYGTDASFYQMTPELVVKIVDLLEMQAFVALAREFKVAITFRAAGTSLSGQAVSDSVLVLLTADWTQSTILNDGLQIKVQPGLIGAKVNQILAPHQRKIGPDPASINTCKVGGIAANNASGMCCGVKNNSYHSLRDITLVLANGAILDTSSKQSREQFSQQNSGLIEQIKTLSEHAKNTPALVEKIQRKYRLKNTTGYGINALIDFTDPIDIIAHLMIGSEGTLGFIADITYDTVAVRTHVSTGLFLFASANEAAAAVVELHQLDVSAAELLDYRALCSVRGKPGLPDTFTEYGESSVALLVEIEGIDAQSLEQKVIAVEGAFSQFTMLQSIAFSSNKTIAEQLWAIRKGTFPAVGAVRETGTTVIIEDVAFPIEHLAQGIEQLQSLFTQFGYDEAIIFGHALDGNLHFVFTQAFNNQQEIEKYDQFMGAVAVLVADELSGSLKAEHGTGRNMAPFVEQEWGSDAYQLMKDIKSIFDPDNIFNPGVIINADPKAHLQNLKALPKAHDTIDKCIECGFCEPACPSADFTLTPRQRIAIWRRIQQLSERKTSTLSSDEKHELVVLKKDYQHYGIDTCAATGMCAQKCPVSIDTGMFIKQLRAERLSKSERKVASWLASHFSATTSFVSFGLKIQTYLQKALGQQRVNRIGRKLRKLNKRIPLWHNKWPTAAHNNINPKLSQTINIRNIEPAQTKSEMVTEQVIVFSTCANRVFGTEIQSKDQRSLLAVINSVFSKAGYELIVIDKQQGLCCGQPFESKGLFDLAKQKNDEVINAVRKHNKGGIIPVIVDASPCAMQLKKGAEQLNQKPALLNENPEDVVVFDLAEFVAVNVLPKLNIKTHADAVALHATCSTKKMATDGYLRQIANALSQNIVEPDGIECCGFAGDKGFTLPELNQHSLKDLPKQVNKCSSGISCSRTCEIGLSLNSGIEYKSFMYLLDQQSS